MNSLDKLIGYFNPEKGFKRGKARAAINAQFQTATPSRYRDVPSSKGDGDSSPGMAKGTIREQARFLEENHDLVNGLLTTLVNNTVGPHGVSVEPQPRDKSGAILTELAEEMEALYADWSMRPEVTWEHDRASMERLIARSTFRDGEVFAQHVMGKVPSLNHGTIVPYSMELLESDLVPHDDDVLGAKNVIQGVRKNAWGRPVAYNVYIDHPGKLTSYSTKTKSIDARIMQHVKLTNRIRQTRGVSALASVMTRLNDLKNYEESERVAARISANVAFAIIKGNPDFYEAPNSEEEDDRIFDFSPGMVVDTLRVGESVSDVSSSRPSQLLQPFRDSMLRAVAAGTGSGYSSIARDYNGTYSSQRQELIEQFVNYSTMTSLLVSQSFRPSRNMFITAALGSGRLKLPAGLDMLTLYDAEFRGPAMPWIDPSKEADANVTQVQAGFKSQSQVIRERGGKPGATMAEIERERKDADERGLSFSGVAPAPAADPPSEQPPAGAGDDTQDEEKPKKDSKDGKEKAA